MNVVVALLALAATPEPVEPPELVKPPALFQRAEPNLEAGAELLADGDVDAAIEAFRAAKPESADERAVVEYDVASALLARAAIAAEAAQKAAQAQQGPNGTAPSEPPAPPDLTDLDDAKGAFERAHGLAKDARLKSEAALAAGNAAISKGDIDDAIAWYRKSIVAFPGNERAKKNLRRALDAKRSQPPPPPQQGGEEDEKKDGEENDEKKDEEQKGDQGEQKGDQGEKKGDKQKGEQGDEKEQKGEQQKGEQGDEKEQKGEQQKGEQGDEKGDKKNEDKQEQETPAQKAKKMKREEARRLLDALRARERPLTPLEMRGQQRKQQPKGGKDW